VEETEVGVEVDQGVVTLTGTVSSYANRMAVEEVAHRVASGLDVGNDIEVVIPGSRKRTDTDIAQAVRWVLTYDIEVPHERIQSTVADGVLTLSGSVDFRLQRGDAERAVNRLAGVRKVINSLTVSVAPRRPEEVRREIEAALERRADRTAKLLHVAVRDDGEVTLSGPVHSWPERRAVLGAARATPGVRAVNDRLRIEAYA